MTKDEALKLALEALEEPKDHIAKHRRLEAITAIKQALEQPEQEPVIFYRCKGCDTAYEDAHPTSCDCMEDKGFERTEYFTSPPKREWVGLTEEEIDLMWKEWKDALCLDHKTWSRAIEAKLKEKNT